MAARPSLALARCIVPSATPTLTLGTSSIWSAASSMVWDASADGILVIAGAPWQHTKGVGKGFTNTMDEQMSGGDNVFVEGMEGPVDDGSAGRPVRKAGGCGAGWQR